jgi:hypothetical protein
MSPLTIGWTYGLLLTFTCGAAYEACCVFWVHFTKELKALQAAFWSVVVCCVTITGTEQFLHDWQNKLAYVLGFGTGTCAAILLKRYMTPRGHSPALTRYLRMREDLARIRKLHEDRESITEDRLLEAMDVAWDQLTSLDLEMLGKLPPHRS